VGVGVKEWWSEGWMGRVVVFRAVLYGVDRIWDCNIWVERGKHCLKKELTALGFCLYLQHIYSEVSPCVRVR